MKSINSKFICKTHYAFTNEKNLIEVTDFLDGGDLYMNMH